MDFRQVTLMQDGWVNLEADDNWRRLRAKADRLENLQYAAEQKIIMVKAKAQSKLPDGPIVYEVTDNDCRQKKAVWDAAQADLVAAKQNAREFGPDLAVVVEQVDHLAQLAVSAKCQFDLAMKQLAFNKNRHDLVAAFEEMLASARKICAAATEGERLCLGLNLKFDTDKFKSVAGAYNEAREKVIAAKSALASVSIMSTASIEPSSANCSALTSASADASISPAALSTVSTFASGTSATFVLVGSCPTSLHLGPGIRFGEPTYHDNYDQHSQRRPDDLVHELFEAARLTVITVSWESAFATARAQWRLLSLPQCMSSGDDDGRDECIVLHLALVRPEVSAIHVRLLLGYLGYPAVVMVKRGYATRRGPREDFAWVRFRTLAEAIDCKWRWDGKGHWGLTPWDEDLDQPRPLHFSFSTDPRYVGLQE